jgi:6-phosphogluconolactonase (cycloisomerase 2 family)
MMTGLYPERLLRAGLAFVVLVAAAVTPAFAQQKILLWVPDRTNNTLGEYEVTPSTGALSAFPPKPTSFSELEVVVSPNLKYLYVGENGGINVFVIDPTGSVVTAPTTLTGNVQGMAFDTTGSFLYVSISTSGQERIETYSINATTGALTLTSTLALSPKLPRGLATDGHGHLFAAIVNDGSNVGYVSAYTMNGNGSLTLIGNTSTGGASGLGPNRLVTNPAGTLLYSSDLVDHAISGFTIAGNGVLSLVGGPVPVGGNTTQPLGLAINPAGTVLLVTDNAASAVDLYSYTIGAGGVLTGAASSPYNTGGTAPGGVTVDPTGANVFVSNTASASVTRFSLNGTSGVLSSPALTSLAGGASPQFLLAKYAPAPLSTVPTVSTWMLALLGMLLAASSILVYRRAYSRS